ncbi:ABC transporter substrate-binding protein [Candidatus Halobonum tyrrellensis]|uniref:Fe/B12 periplasmic-binding domain-containing protein n=1 Tax=Candidatus Halobonum tyrrellensis G22 TaxID=1324957 RepID=V4HJN4_9EURY|nr:ABC transporter substrate-binding protein [Candidatus Halobonum tyrrellensis]ESP89973.1 hypothetical protein K933_00382 [Candidatus Halobonum tyrrellensis G22]
MPSNDTDEQDATRREYVKYGGAVVGAGILAGCAGTDSQSTTESTPAETATGTGTAVTASPTETASTAAAMDPVGEVSFETAPESWVGGFGFTADVLTALGHADGVAGMLGPSYWFQGFYDRIGVSAPSPDEVTKVTSEDWSILAEELYELDPDVVGVDPNVFLYYGLSTEELGRLTDEVAPFFGNASRRTRVEGWPDWPDGAYDYYDIPSFIRRYGRAFGETERAAALVDTYEPALADITSRAPTGSDRPTVGLLNGRYNPQNRDGFVVYDPASEIDRTYGKKQYRDLNVRDAFAGVYDGQSSVTVGYEALLEHDPDVIVFHLGVSHRDLGGENYVQPTVDLLYDNSVTSQVTAVEEDALYVGGTPYQGPIVNLFQTEMTAKQLYPDEFGAWPGFSAGESYPDIPADERLFDRERLAAIVAGDR